MTKSKEVTQDHIKHIRGVLKTADIKCAEENDVKYKINAIQEITKYLKECVDDSGLHKYSQKAMYGHGIEYVGERLAASKIYDEVHASGEIESIFGDM